VTAVLRFRDGVVRHLPVEEWSAAPSSEELTLLQSIHGPVLDVGCGPGRLVAALAEMGTPALGVDASPAAIETARRLGAPVLQRSVFEALPCEGRWTTVLLLDGNVGIGGDPVELLRRLGALLARSGRAVVEVDAPGAPSITADARIERDDAISDWFPWASVGADHLGDVADRAGLRIRSWQPMGGRWFAVLEPGATT
jgi:SAM-dependent methyltransferase